MPNVGQELASLDFASMLGGPLMAVVDAQAKAAMRSVNFIKAVGFEPATVDANGDPVPGKPIYVSFKYPKEIAPFQPATDVVSLITIGVGGAGYTSEPTVTLTAAGVRELARLPSQASPAEPSRPLPSPIPGRVTPPPLLLLLPVAPAQALLQPRPSVTTMPCPHKSKR